MNNNSFITETIEVVISRLQSHPDIVIDKLKINPPALENQIEKEELLPDILREFYRNSNGVELAWHVKSDPITRGGIKMPAIESIHDTRWKPFGMLDYTDDVHAIFHKKSGEESRVMMESLVGDEDIEFADLGGSIITIEEYFIAFGKTLGFRFWQENYSNSTDYSVDSIIANRGYLWGSGDSEDVFDLHSAHIPN